VRRVFVANRGEIAVRIIRACEALGIETVLGYSEPDRETLGVQEATRAVCIGPAAARESYLSVPAIVQAALGTDCDALHPGYGFLAERVELRNRCDEYGLTFVGPKAESIEAMGDKLRSRALADDAGVPTVPGSDAVATADAAREAAEQVGYPALIKASAGGGGRGMRPVGSPAQLATAFAAATAEAKEAFGDGRVYLERHVEKARHVEIQVLGDGEGRAIDLGERECSVQRRHQKLLEESPSPVLSDLLREQIARAAVALAQRARYLSAGTVEFVFDERTGEFFFLEMNTRIQVEHPVTEMVTGADLVAEQLRLAAGETLIGRPAHEGHAIECRINAEDPARGFAPHPGRLTRWRPPEGDDIRVDTHCYEGYTVPPYYDSLLAKLIVAGPDRPAVIERTIAALEDFEVEGVPTTIPFHLELMHDEAFRARGVDTRWVDERR
jgi:acetyl-CoA carboxylase biotin carboxylase subunit